MNVKEEGASVHTNFKLTQCKAIATGGNACKNDSAPVAPGSRLTTSNATRVFNGGWYVFGNEPFR